MKPRLLILALVCLVVGIAAILPKQPLYVNPDGTIAAPTQFLSRVFLPGAGISITDNRTNLLISATGGGGGGSPIGPGTNTSVRAVGGTNLIDVTGELNNWANYPTSVLASVAGAQALLAASNGVAIGPGSNITVATNADGSRLVYTITASLVGGAASMGDITNVVLSYVSDNATNLFAASGTFFTNWVNAISNLTYTLASANTNHAAAVLQSGTNFTRTAVAPLQAGSAMLTNWANAETVLLPVVTNYLYASDIVCSMTRRTQGAVTNAMSGNLNVLLTNICVGSHLRINVAADGSARTVSFFWPAGVSVTLWSTNATVDATNLLVAASKRGVFFFECSQTNVVTGVFGGQP